MKQKPVRLLAAAVLTGSVLCTDAVLGEMPAPASAAEEYLIRDRWGYCRSANYAESEHFVIFYGNQDTTGQVNDAFLKRNLADYEKLWHCYSEYLGMTDLNVDIYGKSSQKYKTNVYLTNTGLPQFQEGWAFMSSEDGYGIEIISPDAMLDDLTIAHEFGHVVTMQQKAWVDQEITGAWWEPLANWFREMYLLSDYYTGSVKTVWFEPYLRNLSLSFPHGRDYYEVWPFLVYLETNPDHLPGLGQFTVKRIISEAKPDEYPFDTAARLCGTDAQTLFGHYAKRMATFDLGAKEAYRQEFEKKCADSPYFRSLFCTVPEDDGSGLLRAPQWDAPMQGGINVIPLEITGDRIRAELRGLSDDPAAGWKACIVTTDSTGMTNYSGLFGDGESAEISASGAVSAYLTVSAMPDSLYRVNAFHKETDSPYRTGDERRRYPYEIRLSGAAVPQSAGYVRGKGHAHPNGGGWVADTASVADSVYVGPDAMVLGAAKISDSVRITGHAVVAGNTVIRDSAVIADRAVVHGGGWVYVDGWKTGDTEISGNTIISGNAVVSGMCRISGDAKITQKAYVCDAVTVSGHAVIKGMSYLYGGGTYSGEAITDGDYANTESRSSGVGFGWLDDGGWHRTPAGYAAAYDFAEQTAFWARDGYTATDLRQSGAVWAAERSTAKGVMNLDGSACLLPDRSLFRTNDLQITMTALWKGENSSRSVQELLHFGDDSAYISLTPSDRNGNAALTVTDGKTAVTLTAPALQKGVWNRVTIRLIGGKASLLINGTEADSRSCPLTPLDVMCAAQQDTAVIGKGFRGAVDEILFSFQETDEPQTVCTGSEPPEDEPVRGDVNADGTVDQADAVMLDRYLLCAGSVTDWSAGDLHEDGRLDAADLALLKRYLLRT